MMAPRTSRSALPQVPPMSAVLAGAPKPDCRPLQVFNRHFAKTMLALLRKEMHSTRDACV